MELSKEQIKILRIFYQHNEIRIADFSKYKINEKNEAFNALKGVYLRAPYFISNSKVPYSSHSYKINENGKAFIETLDTQKKTLFWSDFRSWVAFVLSIASFFLSIFLQ